MEEYLKFVFRRIKYGKKPIPGKMVAVFEGEGCFIGDIVDVVGKNRTGC